MYDFYVDKIVLELTVRWVFIYIDVPSTNRITQTQTPDC